MRSMGRVRAGVLDLPSPFRRYAAPSLSQGEREK